MTTSDCEEIMDSRKVVLNETGVVALGELVLCAIMVGVFAALGYFDMSVLWGAVVGALVIVCNYFFMAITVSVASEKAAQGDAKAAQNMIQLSSAVRLLLMGGAVFLAIKLGCNVFATLLPLAFVRPILLVTGFFRKKGDA